MLLKGKVWKFGDNISTDHIIPGRFYHLRSDLDELTKHVFEDIAPDFYKKIQAHLQDSPDVVVAFGAVSQFLTNQTTQ